MKTNKKGKIRLERGDYRVGNFIFHEENNYIKVIASSGIVSWRVSLDLSVAMLIKDAIDNKRDVFLHTYASATFSQLCVVPDVNFFEKHAQLVNAQVEAHPEYYGKQKPSDDKAEDDKILEEERELHETVEKPAQ